MSRSGPWKVVSGQWGGFGIRGSGFRVRWPFIIHRSSFIICHAACCLLSGCGERIDTAYGQRSGPEAALSVNGTAVLAGMFEQAGHRVSSRYALSPGLLGRANCTVWFPDDFRSPPEDVRAWLEEWLAAAPGRTLIYVGRDFDAAPLYWEKIEGLAPPEQQVEIARRKTEAATQFQTGRQCIPAKEPFDWFTCDCSRPARKVRSLQGDPEWLEGIDPSRVEIELNGRLAPAGAFEVLLESEGDALVAVQRSEEFQLIVVANGSFLLNLPLVNHEHRKLAGRLIGAVGPPGQTVIFLESGSGGPPIRQQDRAPGPPTGLEIFHLWPTNWILLHLAVVGVVFCLSRYPIFGRPRDPQPESASDFGKHVQALADLLEKTRDRDYAAARMAHYRQTAHPERKDERKR